MFLPLLFIILWKLLTSLRGINNKQCSICHLLFIAVWYLNFFLSYLFLPFFVYKKCCTRNIVHCTLQTTVFIHFLMYIYFVKGTHMLTLGSLRSFYNNKKTTAVVCSIVFKALCTIHLPLINQSERKMIYERTIKVVLNVSPLLTKAMSDS